MERLPYIDEHSIEVAATPERTWEALLSVLRGELGADLPRPVFSLMRLEPANRRGGWPQGSGDPRPGDALPGFEVRKVRPAEHLGLGGRHRFSRYALVLELEDDAGATRLRALTYAEFPGILGRGYRAIVIDSRAHRLIVRRLLRRVAERA